MARPNKTLAVHSASAKCAKQRGLAPKLQELSRLAETLQSEVNHAELQLKQLTQHEQVLQHVVTNKSQIFSLLSREVALEDIRSSSSSSASSSLAIQFPEGLISQARSRTWQCWNEVNRLACQRMALLLSRLDSPAAEASPAPEELEQAIKEYDMQLALIHIHCQDTYIQCISRNCDTGEVRAPSAAHWQHVARKVQYNEEQLQTLATGFTMFAKAQQQLREQQAHLQEQLQQLCNGSLLGAYGHVEVEGVLDQLMDTTKRMSQAEYSLATLLWTTVSTPRQKAQLIVASYPYWLYSAAVAKCTYDQEKAAEQVGGRNTRKKGSQPTRPPPQPGQPPQEHGDQGGTTRARGQQQGQGQEGDRKSSSSVRQRQHSLVLDLVDQLPVNGATAAAAAASNGATCNLQCHGQQQQQAGYGMPPQPFVKVGSTAVEGLSSPDAASAPGGEGRVGELQLVEELLWHNELLHGMLEPHLLM